MNKKILKDPIPRNLKNFILNNVRGDTIRRKLFVTVWRWVLIALYIDCSGVTLIYTFVKTHQTVHLT